MPRPLRCVVLVFLLVQVVLFQRRLVPVQRTKQRGPGRRRRRLLRRRSEGRTLRRASLIFPGATGIGDVTPTFSSLDHNAGCELRVGRQGRWRPRRGERRRRRRRRRDGSITRTLPLRTTPRGHTALDSGRSGSSGGGPKAGATKPELEERARAGDCRDGGPLEFPRRWGRQG